MRLPKLSAKNNKSKGKFKPGSFFTSSKLLFFILAFGMLGGLFVYRSFAATTLAGNAGEFHPLNPARILDTRNGNGGYKVPIKANSEIVLTVNGRGGVPASNVSAVALNVAVTGTQKPGFLTIYPSGTSRPTTSNINFMNAGQTIANSATVKVGTDGKLRIFNGSSGTTHVIVDVSGYFTTKNGPNGLRYLNRELRVLDTRQKLGAKAAIPANGEIVLSVKAALEKFEKHSGATTEAVALTLTAVSPAAPGYITAYPAGISRPTVSALNLNTGQTIANTVIVKLGSNGQVRLFNGSSKPVHLVGDIDASFYDRARNNTSADGRLVPVNPYRAMDTRSGLGGRNGALTGQHNLTLAGRNGLPKRVRGVIANTTVTQPTAAGHITFTSGRTSALNFTTGQTIAASSHPGLGGSGILYVQRGGSGSVHVIVDIYGYYAL